MDNERLNLPSASGMERLALCPGSRTLEMSQPDETTDESDLGQKAHTLASRYFSALSAAGEGLAGFPWPPMPQEMYAGIDLSLAEVVDRYIDIANAAFQSWLVRCPEVHKVQIIVEKRIFLHGSNFMPVTSGQPDVVFMVGRHAFIPDLKSLNGEHAESPENLQLRTYALLVNEEHGCTDITVAIIQPRISKNAVTCRYTPPSLVASRTEIDHYLAESERPDAPLIAGKQCRNCRARGVCPVAGEYAELEPVAPARELARGEAVRIVALLTVEERVALWEKSKTVDKILKAVKENLLALPVEVLAEQGLEVLSQKGDREVKDGPAAWETLKDVLTPEGWNRCCSVGITKLESEYRAATHLPVKDTKKELETRLGNLISRRADSRALSRIKATSAATQPTPELPAPAAAQ